MKVTLDLSRLLQDGAITGAEHDRLSRLGRQETGLLLVNVLIGFGVVAVTGGALALVPSTLTGIAIGVALMLAGIGLVLSGRPQWGVLASICVLIAALLLGAGIVLFSQGVIAFGDGAVRQAHMSVLAALLLVAALFAASAVLARSALLAALVVLVLFAALGGSGDYFGRGSYGMEVTQPLATVVLFAVLALAAHLLSRALPSAWERLASTVARTSLLLVNLGFWVGSLWGDDLTWLNRPPKLNGTVIDMSTALSAPALWFSVSWAAALAGVAIWAGLADRRWALNIVTVFGGIDFYTQWFEHLGATPASVLAAGVIVLLFAVALWRINRRTGAPHLS